jgi:hypothetical protein
MMNRVLFQPIFFIDIISSFYLLDGVHFLSLLIGRLALGTVQKVSESHLEKLIRKATNEKFHTPSRRILRSNYFHIDHISFCIVFF